MRRICVAILLIGLAGCGSSDSSAPRSEPEPAPATGAPAAPPLAAGGGGAAGGEPLPDPIGRRLSSTCAAAQEPLRDVSDPGGLAGVAANAETEIDVLDGLRRRLRAAKVDGRRRDALRRYLVTLRHEIDVDRLIMAAANATDGAAVDDLVDQNVHNRRTRRRLADEALGAMGCRPGPRITD